MRSTLRELIIGTLTALQQSGELPAVPFGVPEILDTKQPEHGDFACNIAMTAAKAFAMNPRELAELIARNLRDRPELSEVEVAGPGFLNLRLSRAFLGAELSKISDGFWQLKAVQPQKINVEFVSVNPNGPITIGSGRGAAYGSTLCHVLEAAGHQVWREYYINDGVNSEQMRLFAESVKALATGNSVPENGYRGDYVQAVADAVSVEGMSDEALRRASEQAMIAAQQHALDVFRTQFDCWFSEQSLHDAGLVDEELQILLQKGLADDQPIRNKLKLAKGGVVEDVEVEEQPNDEDDAAGSQRTIWLRSTKFLDDQDRVLQRKDGRLTYIASDIAYHKDKFNRPPNADKLITVLGPDHHGYIGRLRAVVAAVLIAEKGGTEAEALELAKEKLTVQIFQLVRFMKDGKPAPMRKRDGNIYALIDLVSEIGAAAAPDAPEDVQLGIGTDVTRFFYLSRSHDTTFDFDLDLAQKQSDENPVFYVQYAYARINSILVKAKEHGLAPALSAEFEDSREIALIRKIADLPYEVGRCAEDYGVHRLATYATELARAFHTFYDGCRVIQPEDTARSNSRLLLAEKTQIALKGALSLLGIQVREAM